MNIPIVLDTCAILSLLRIDKDRILCNSLLNVPNIYISPFVWDNELYYVINRKEFSEEQKECIYDELRILYPKVKIDYDDSFDNAWANTIREHVNYTKKDNGELFSTAYSLRISRLNQCRVCFYTDDIGAKDELNPFFEYQQIGYICDSVDLLVLLYRTDQTFTLDSLHNFLRELYSEYSLSFNKFSETIAKNKDEWKKRYKRDAKCSGKISALEESCKDVDVERIKSILSFFEGEKKYNDIFSEINQYPNITDEGYMCRKINRTISSIQKKKELYKI